MVNRKFIDFTMLKYINHKSSLLLTLLTAFLFLYPFRQDGEALFPYFDKVVHIIIFSSLGFFWLISASKKHASILTQFFVSLSLLTYGVCIEITQDLMPFDRAFDVWDIVADSGGILISILIYRLMN